MTIKKIKFYRLPNKINVNNNTLLKAFFEPISEENVPLETLLTLNNTSVTLPAHETPKYIQNQHALENAITIYYNNRDPLLEYNYMSIEMTNDFVHYFFITEYIELGASQVRYILRKDTLNTYLSQIDTPYVDIEDSFGLVLREHKDRFEESTNNPIYNREIENLDIMPKIVELEKTVEPQRTMLALTQFGGTAIDSDVLSIPKYFWEIYSETNNVISLKREPLTIDLPLGWGFRANGKIDVEVDGIITTINNPNGYDWLIWKETENHFISVATPDYTPDYILGSNASQLSRIGSVFGVFFTDTTDTTSVRITFRDYNQIEIYYDGGIYKNLHDTWDYDDTQELKNKKVFSKIQVNPSTKDSFAKAKNKRQLNKSNRKIVKVIQLPYDIKVDYLLPKVSKQTSTGSFTEGLYFEILSEVKLNQNVIVGLHNYIPNYQFSNNIKHLKFDFNDPKLYTNQFNPFFLTFYNESINLAIERASGGIVVSNKLNTSDYSKIRLSLSNHEEVKPFDNIRTIDMNNEVATFKNDLANYIDTLYANDLKLMQLQEAQATRNIWKSGINIGTSAAAGFIAGSMTLNPAGATVGTAAGAVKGVINLGFAIADAQSSKRQREIEMEQKLTTLQNSLIDIAGASPEMHELNDTDTFKLYKIQPNAIELEYLDNYFHLYGYQTLELKKPNIRSRTWWNHLQMHFEELYSILNLPLEVELDIRDRFAKGVTIFHYIDGEGWDLEQKYENKETYL